MFKKWGKCFQEWSHELSFSHSASFPDYIGYRAKSKAGPTVEKVEKGGEYHMTTTVNDEVKKIRAMLGFGGMPDVDLLKRMDAIRDGMNGNAAFPHPPVDMVV